MKRIFEDQYKTFKRDAIYIFLRSIKYYKYDPDLLSKLSDVKEFRNYFKQPFVENQNRWHGVLNGLNEYHLKDILAGLAIFKTEIEYILNNVNINDPEILAFLKRLSQALYSLKETTLDYDEIKPWSNFIWELFGGFSFIEGSKDYDVVENMIKKI